VEFDAREERERMPEKVLLATDGSKDAALAARAAVDVCEGTGAQLHVVHAWQSVPTARLRPFMRAELKKLGNELLEEGVKRVEDSGGLVTGAHLVEGRAADEILDLAGQIGAGPVVIGSRGLGPVGRIVLGSVSEAVIHHSHWPVLVLRGGEDAWPPERVIFGDDGSEAARAAGDLGASLCGHHGGPRCYTPTRGCRRWTPKAEGSTRGSWTMSFGERRGPSWSARENSNFASARARRFGWWWATRRPPSLRPRRRTHRRGPYWPSAAGNSG
jgi:nucleotide-binding universal stress UspA family protein